MDFAQLLGGVNVAPALTKLLLVIASILILRTLAKNDVERVVPWFYGALGFLFLRDLLALFLPLSPVLAFSAALFPAFALALAAGRSRPALVGASFAVGLALGLAGLYFADPSGSGDRYSFVPALAGALVAALVLVFSNFGDSSFATQLDRSGRFAALLVIALPPAMGLLAGSELVNLLGLPVAYLAFLRVVLAYTKALNDGLISERDYLSDTIETLYKFVLRASDSLRGSPDLTRLLDYVAETLHDETGADGAMILLVDDFEDSVSARSVFGSFTPISRRPEEVPRTPAGVDTWLNTLKVPLGEGLIGETAQSGKAALVRTATTDPRVDVDPLFPTSSVIAVPLLIDDRIIGVGVAVRKFGRPSFEDADFDRSSLLADFASLVINNVFSIQETTERGEINREASIAAEIQKAMQPKRIPDLQTAAFGAFSTPARGVSSDYYDVILARKNRVYLIAGDVAGKGIPASLIMVMIRAILHLLTNAEKDVATILNWINRGITGKIDLDHFATLQIIAYDPSTGICEYANAGHRPPLLWRESTGLVDALEMESVPIGVEKTTAYTSNTFTLEDGDILLLYTDGVVEAINQSGRQYGMKSLTTILHKFHELSAKEIANKVNADVRSFVGTARQYDDQTLLAMKVKR